MWQAAPGQSLLMPSGPSGNHLFFVILGPIQLDNRGSTPQVLTVSVTSIKPDLPFDDACVLKVGDHPFIQHDSYVAYRHLRIDPLPHVERLVQSGVWQPHTPCSPELLERIIRGVHLSRMTSRENKKIFGG
jgi:hypothetical protein